MSQTKTAQIFSQQIKRIQLITDKHTQTELADFFGIRQSSISDAKRRSTIPSTWLVKLMLSRNINPEWVLTGNGPCCMNERPTAHDDLYTRRAKEEDAAALRRLSSKALADELLRRIAIAAVEQ